MSDISGSCIVALPIGCNCATSDPIGATTLATHTQPISLKALAEAVFIRNQARNSCATKAENTRNFSTEKAPLKLHDLPPLKRATSYPCGKCDGTYYTEVQDSWRCDNCTVVFEIIGGTRGPEIIH